MVNQKFPNSGKGAGVIRNFAGGIFFTRCWEPEEEWFWRFKLCSKLKTAFCKYWTLVKIKISMSCVSKEYESNTKMAQLFAIIWEKLVWIKAFIFINFVLVPRLFCLFDLHLCRMKKRQTNLGTRSTYSISQANEVDFQLSSQGNFFAFWINCISEIKETPCNRN